MAEPDRLDELRIDRNAEPPPRPGRRWAALAVVAVLAAAAAAWWFAGRAGAVQVRTAEVTAADGGPASVSVLDASGYVTARRQATVSSKITGRLETVEIEEGMAVEEGQVLARLDDSTASRELALAEAESAAAESRLAEIEVRPRQARTDLERFEAVLAESLLPALAGGLAGGGLAYLAVNGYQTATINWQTFSQVAFQLAVTPELLAAGLAYALAMGLPVAVALRQR